MSRLRAEWESGTVTVNGQEWATKDANGADLIYPGPDGLAYFQGAPILNADDYAHAQLTQSFQREWAHG